MSDMDQGRDASAHALQVDPDQETKIRQVLAHLNDWLAAAAPR